jgi:Zn finger protein HypA/HybF involved in hydrogenase expression
MHESSLIQRMLEVVEKVQKEKPKDVVKGITVELPAFGALTEEHFRFHFEEAVKNTAWKNLELEIVKVPQGVDAILTHVTMRAKD